MRRKMVVLSTVILVIALFSASFDEERKYKNLKVLDKNISDEDMELIMKEFKTALGVKCNFCHAKSKTDSTKMDYASDDNNHKHISRDMMRMTNRINKQYFKEMKERGVRCFTCHRGEKEPKDPPKEVLEN
jgi:hypothetical protein